MKILKVIGIIILVVIVLIIVVGLIAPKNYSVERTVVINAPKDLVFDHIKYWRNWLAWSPWAERDSAMVVTYEGKDGEPGSVYKWEGNPKITGKGEMSNFSVKESEEVVYHMHFIQPWESQSDGYFRVSDNPEGTKVAWGFYGKNSFPWNIMMLFMSMDKMMGKDFDHGLELLKGICEKEAELIDSYDIQEQNYAGQAFAAIRNVVAFKDIKMFFTQSFTAIMKAMGDKKIGMAGVPSGLYFSWDEQAQTTDMAAAIPVKKNVTAGEIQTITIPAGTAYIVDYYGPYSGSMFAYKAMDYYFKSNQLESRSPIMEEYVTDPSAEPDSTKWLTKIYFFAK